MTHTHPYMMQFFLRASQSLGLLIFISSSCFNFVAYIFLGIARGETSPTLDVPALCDADWQGEIEAIIRRREFARAQWGILVQPLDAERPLYALNERSYFLGASTVKLLTTAAVLSKLGADYRIRTPFYAMGQPPVLETLLVAGRGDPSLRTEELSAIAQQLYRQGLRQIDQLIADDRYFPEPNRPPTWEFEDLFFSYAPGVNSLILNQNQFSLTFSPQQTGEPVQLSWHDEIAAAQWQIQNSIQTSPALPSNRLELNGILGQPILQIRGTLAVDAPAISWNLAILEPGQYFLDTLKAVLELEGIEVRQARLATPQEQFDLGSELTTIESPHLATLIQETNQESNNLYAEALLSHLGAIAGNQDHRNAGLNIVQNTLTELGINPESYVLTDASGLSRHNLVSPEALVQTLMQMAKSPHFATYHQTLAIAGVSGTLKNRFQNTLVQGNLRGKTGTLRNVSALSGYLEGTKAQPWVFSIILNKTTEPAIKQRQAIDEIVLVLANLKVCH
jgi:D-alanyl-D-alanine carboxypeptidase/D-alanyl-D-alanine-endopeptidase (penicillin-binding protein 4)